MSHAQVYKQQKNSRNAQKTALNQADAVATAEFPAVQPSRGHAPSKSLSNKAFASEPNVSQQVPPAPVTRPRNSSISGLGGFSRPKTPLGVGISNTSPAPLHQSLGRRPSKGGSAMASRKPMDLSIEKSNGPVRRAKPPGGRARNRESLDLDDIMGGDDEEETTSPALPPMTPKSAAPIKSSTRDLIDFLSEGPPDLPSNESPPSLNNIEKPAKGGRFTRMVSRLGRGPSAEQLSHNPPPSSAGHALSIANGSSPRQRSTTLSNSLTRSNSHLKKQRSIGNLSISSQTPQTPNAHIPQVPVPPAVYARPPPRSSGPPSPNTPTNMSQEFGSTSQSGSSLPVSQPVSQAPSAERQKSGPAVHRKAVPQWDGSGVPPASQSTSTLNTPATSPTERKKPNGIHTTGSVAPPSPASKDASFYTPPQSAVKQSMSVPERPPVSTARGSVSPSRQGAGLPLAEVQEMRGRLATATSAAEARLLVDLYLVRWGIPAPLIDPASTSAEKDGFADSSGSNGAQDAGVMELLLGDSVLEEYVDPLAEVTPALATPSPVNRSRPNGAPHTSSGPGTYSTPHTPTQSPSVPAISAPRSTASQKPDLRIQGHQHQHAYGNGIPPPVMVGGRI